MPVKKRPGKERAARITPEMVDAFRIARDTRAGREACIRGMCPGGNGMRHCDNCRKHMAAAAIVRRGLQLPPWWPDVFSVDDPEPPTWAAKGSAWRDEWETVWELRQRLEEAALDA